MSDQADGLRRLVRERSTGGDSIPARTTPRRARSLVLTSGKGGVGTSNLALNLAIALGEGRGGRVVLVDADFGLANIDLLCGLSPAGDLGDVLAGGRPLAEAIVPGPAGIRIIPGAHGSRTWVDAMGDAPSRLLAELAGLEAGADFLVVDAGSGLGPSIGALASAADEVVVVATPEPTAMADAQATIRRLRRLPTQPTLRAVVNQAASRAEGLEALDRLSSASRQFLGAVVDGLGVVRSDPRVPLAVRARTPFTTAYPSAAASRDVRRLARALLDRDGDGPIPRSRRPGFFAALAARWALARVALKAV